ncbi:MAG: hypothetical protein IJ654_08750 [Bacteroidales bacterium]|nr:hypothetical protein [Bacteroidales bacterium]
MKRVALLLALVAAAACSAPQASVYPQVTAHRGCHLDGLVPENSIAGIETAARFGYPAIEMDVKYTLDSVLVIMHDNTINRTMRHAADYSEIAEPVRVTASTFEDLRTNYVFASEDPALRQPIPTLVEMLEACKRCGIHPVLHSHINDSYDVAQEMLGDDWTCFTSLPANVDYVRTISKCDVLLDPGKSTAEECVAKLTPYGERCGMSTMNYHMLDGAYIAAMHEAGLKAQSSIFPVPHEADAIHDKADIILSDFCWLQTQGRQPMLEKKARKVALDGDAVYGLTCPKELEYGAMVLEFRYVGKGTVTVNGEARYALSSDTEDTFLVGFRSLRQAPSFEVKAGEGGCVLKSVRIRFYEI